MERRARVWSRLYDSSEDGLSLTNFVFKIRQVKHTLIIVRDTEGHVFAMYNGDKWLDPSDLKEHFARKAGGGGGGARGKQDQNFYGEGNCALLAVAPTREVFLPTKADANYLHLQTAWPEAERNGVAMGGLPGFFAVHLHAGLEEGSCRGMSGRSSTFNSPCLASTEDFKIDMIEAWALSDEVLQAAECTDVGVMGRAETKTDKMMLELVGRDFYSAE